MQQTDPLGGVMTFGYDAAGNRTAVTDLNRQLTADNAGTPGMPQVILTSRRPRRRLRRLRLHL